MRLVAAAAAAAGLALAGCGSSPGNTIELTISGLGPARSVLVTENGQGSCNGGKLRQLSSTDVINARVAARSLKKDITGSGQAFTPRSAKAHRTFAARTIDGTVQWSELYRPLPAEFSRAELLALRLSGELCG